MKSRHHTEKGAITGSIVAIAVLVVLVLGFGGFSIWSYMGKWTPVAVGEYDGPPPVVILENKNHAGEFEAHTGLIDRINTGILYRLVTMAIQTAVDRKSVV